MSYLVAREEMKTEDVGSNTLRNHPVVEIQPKDFRKQAEDKKPSEVASVVGRLERIASQLYAKLAELREKSRSVMRHGPELSAEKLTKGATASTVPLVSDLEQIAEKLEQILAEMEEDCARIEA